MTFTHVSQLGKLADPEYYTGPIDISGISADQALRFFECMLRIRYVEEAIGDWAAAGQTSTPCHLGIGQEAIGAGVSAVLDAQDRVFGAHRSHAHFIGLGGDVFGLLAEVLGKKQGVARGMGGSMHLTGREVGFGGSVPIVGATIPIAVGAALAAAFDKEGAIAVSYFGDGAAEEGVLHESLNLAKVLCLPILFVCENNLYSSHLDIQLRQPSDRVARYAEAHLIDTAVIDGNDVVRVAKTSQDLVGRIRAGTGPAFLEAVTYRHRGHVGPREDADVGVRRSMELLRKWKMRDPLFRLEEALLQHAGLRESALASIKKNVRAEVKSAARAAVDCEFPEPEQLMEAVYE